MARCAQRTIGSDATVRERRTIVSERAGRDPKGLVPPDLVRRARGLDSGRRPQVTATVPAVPERSIHDAQARHGPARHAGAGRGRQPVNDVAVDEAYDGLGATWQMLSTAYRRDTLDDKGLPLVATVHFERDYDNAFWDGAQMVFGDGDGVYFDRFTSCLDVIGHELTHGFTQYTAGLTYVGQSGALNERVSDCFGSMVKQMRAARPPTRPTG